MKTWSQWWRSWLRRSGTTASRSWGLSETNSVSWWRFHHQLSSRKTFSESSLIALIILTITIYSKEYKHLHYTDHVIIQFYPSLNECTNVLQINFACNLLHLQTIHSSWPETWSKAVLIMLSWVSPGAAPVVSRSWRSPFPPGYKSNHWQFLFQQ